MFHMFNKLLLISDGYPVYYGKARGSMEYFSSLRFVPEIPMNPAEFLLDLATGQVNDISVPEDLSISRGSPDFEKAVVKVRTTNDPLIFSLSLNYFPISLSTFVSNFVLVSTTPVQDSTGAKRERRESSINKDPGTSSSGY